MSLFLSISFKQLIVMNTLENGATLFASSYPTIEKRISVPGVVLSLIMLLAGIVLFLLVWLCDLHTSTVSMALMVAGIALILWAVFRLFWKVNKRIYTPTGSVVEERTLYFGQEDLNRLVDCFENRCWERLQGIHATVHGGVRMDILASKDGQFAAVQLFQYVPHTYTPVTSICTYEESDAGKVADFLARC